ncbi:MAG: hypothetical protein NE327_03355 [Lentisphaeraceae bacterium]|nr:hypothetical protein [Lentisphaeraceae bacterium]
MKNLLFVYNADSGRFNALTDSLHKLISPDTYECRLCQLTHGFFSEKTEWSSFLKEQNFKASFLHRDEFVEKFPNSSSLALPAVFIITDENFSTIISAEEFKSINNLSELCAKLKSAI